MELRVGHAGYATLRLMTAGVMMLGCSTAAMAQPRTPAGPADESTVSLTLRPSDWRGAAPIGQEECRTTSGEFTYWVYTKGTQCGVPREQADRLVLIRLPTLDVAPLKAAARMPGGRYAVWVYGAGDPGHPWLHMCARLCANGALTEKMGWVFLDWLQIRENQLLYLRTWQVPYSHRLEVRAVVLSSKKSPPDWTP